MLRRSNYMTHLILSSSLSGTISSSELTLLKNFLLPLAGAPPTTFVTDSDPDVGLDCGASKTSEDDGRRALAFFRVSISSTSFNVENSRRVKRHRNCVGADGGVADNDMNRGGEEERSSRLYTGQRLATTMLVAQLATA
jgi:hypothetical protein